MVRIQMQHRRVAQNVVRIPTLHDMVRLDHDTAHDEIRECREQLAYEHTLREMLVATLGAEIGQESDSVDEVDKRSNNGLYGKRRVSKVWSTGLESRRWKWTDSRR